MAIEFVGFANASVNNGTSLSVEIPAAAQAGDVLVLVVRSWTAERTSIYGAWDQRIANTSRGGGSVLEVLTKTHPGGQQPVSISFAGNGHHHANLLAFRGVDPNTPVDAAAQAYSDTGTSNITPSVTTTVPNCKILRTVASGNSLSSRSFTWPATVDELTDTRSTAGYSYISTAASDSGPSAGPVGTVMATFSTSAYGIMATLALRPKPTSRLRIGGTPVPLMLGNTEVEIMGP